MKGQLCPIAGMELTVPDEKGVLVKETAGTDYVCILVSAEKLDEFADIRKGLVGAYGHQLHKKLKRKLGAKLIPDTDIEWHKDNIGFKAKSTNGSVVALIIEM